MERLSRAEGKRGPHEADRKPNCITSVQFLVLLQRPITSEAETRTAHWHIMASGIIEETQWRADVMYFTVPYRAT